MTALEKESKRLEKEIRRLEKTLAGCKDLQRRTFLMATINIYSKRLGKPEPYPDYQ